MTDDFLGAKIALFLGDQLLVVLRDDRPDIPFPNTWDFPGGGREGNETPWQTAQRETVEEVGLTLSSEDIVWSRAYGSASNPKQTSWFFVVKRPATDWALAHLGDEGQKMGRMTVQEYADHPQNIPHFSDRLRDFFATL